MGCVRNGVRRRSAGRICKHEGCARGCINIVTETETIWNDDDYDVHNGHLAFV